MQYTVLHSASIDNDKRRNDEREREQASFQSVKEGQSQIIVDKTAEMCDKRSSEYSTVLHCYDVSARRENSLTLVKEQE